MKDSINSILIALTLILIVSCHSQQNNAEAPDLFTGNTETYTLYQASEFAVEGKVILSELKTGFTQIDIQITPTERGLLHPVHVHFSTIEMNGGIAAVLNPIDGETGFASTVLMELEDASTMKYQDLIRMDASMKIHFSSTPPEYKTLLVGGNIGSAQSEENPFGSREITVCQ